MMSTRVNLTKSFFVLVVPVILPRFKHAVRHFCRLVSLDQNKRRTQHGIMGAFFHRSTTTIASENLSDVIQAEMFTDEVMF